MINISNDRLVEMAYESAMYTLYNFENLMIVKQMWDRIDVEEIGDEEKPKSIKQTTVKLDYQR